MNPYPAYCPSGIEWLDELPEHWETKRLKIVASINDDTLSEREHPLRTIAYVDISSIDSTFGITKMDEMFFEDAPSRARRLVCDGDTIVSTVRTYLRAIAPVSAPPLELVVSTGFAVIRPRAMDPGFASWVLREQGLVEEIVARSTGVSYPAINASQIGELPVPLPPFDEQSAIAVYLDRETECIDILMAKQRLLIERLEEYRAALITSTVTRGLPPEAARTAGLDPSPRLKSSGVAWLGDVPENWEVKRLGSIGSFFKGSGGTKEDEVEDGVSCVRYGDIYTQYQYFIRETRANISEESTAKYTPISYGDILFAGSGETIEEIGKSAVNLMGGVIYCGGDVIVFRPSIETDATFMGYSADCFTSIYQKACMGRGVTVMHIYSQDLRHLLILLPPLDEQRAIAAYLDHETERIDVLVMKHQQLIARLQEYRTALITAVVTGKIDVRGQSMESAQ